MARRWNVTLSCLWLLLAVYRAAYASCDEYDNQILPGQLLFAPERLLSSGSCLTATVATWRGCSHLRPRSYRHRCLLYYHWLILLSGDVESNPGPVKFPCTRCCKAVIQNDRAILCNRCKNWNHAACCGISHKQYQLHTVLGDTEEWLCHACIASDLLFGNVSTISDSLSTSSPSHDTCLWGVSIEDSWQRFKDLLFAAADECIPKVTLWKRRKKTWLGDETLRMIRWKRRAYKVMKRTGRDSDIRRYRALNTVRDLTTVRT